MSLEVKIRKLKCSVCETSFETTCSWRKFCNPNCKAKASYRRTKGNGKKLSRVPQHN